MYAITSEGNGYSELELLVELPRYRVSTRPFGFEGSGEMNPSITIFVLNNHLNPVWSFTFCSVESDSYQEGYVSGHRHRVCLDAVPPTPQNVSGSPLY